VGTDVEPFDGAVIGGNRNADDSDEHLIQTLRTCRLEVLVERGLDGAIGQVSVCMKRVTVIQLRSAFCICH
jgi:hypothetical protein